MWYKTIYFCLSAARNIASLMRKIELMFELSYLKLYVEFTVVLHNPMPYKTKLILFIILNKMQMPF